MQLNSDQWDVREKGHMTHLGNFSKKELTFLLLHLSHRLECRSNGWSSSNLVGYAVKAAFWEWQGNRIEKLSFLFWSWRCHTSPRLLISEFPLSESDVNFYLMFSVIHNRTVFIAWLLIWATLSHELILSNQPC